MEEATTANIGSMSDEELREPSENVTGEHEAPTRPPD